LEKAGLTLEMNTMMSIGVVILSLTIWTLTKVGGARQKRSIKMQLPIMLGLKVNTPSCVSLRSIHTTSYLIKWWAIPFLLCRNREIGSKIVPLNSIPFSD